MLILAIIVAIVGVCAFFEWQYQARTFPEIPLWKVKGAATMALFVVMGIVVPGLLSLVLPQVQLFDIRHWPDVAQTAVGIMVVQAGVYAWHRTAHAISWYYDRVHIVHHRPARVDSWSAFYFHPADMITMISTGTILLVFTVRVTPELLMAITALNIFFAVFQHTNISTPHWLGYFLMRPEAHCVHHEKGVYGYNYGDIALYDQLFGTYRNPKTWQGEVGVVDPVEPVPEFAGQALDGIGKK